MACGEVGWRTAVAGIQTYFIRGPSWPSRNLKRTPIRGSISRIPAYVPGKSHHDVGRAIVKLSSNENPYGPPPRAVEAVRKAASEMHRYPDAQARELRTRLSEYLDVPYECVSVSGGSDDILSNIAKLYLGEGDNLVTHSGFMTYLTISLSMGAERRLVPDAAEPKINTDGLLEACDGRTKILLVCTPNNPTGAILSRGQTLQLLDKAGEIGIVVFDEAYSEFSEEYWSPIHEILERDLDAVVTRTFSKAFGLAGLRVGYSVAPRRITKHLELVRMPFSVSSLAQAAAIAALDDRAIVEDRIRRIRESRQLIARELERLGLKVIPSQANFVMVDVGAIGMDAASFSSLLLERRIAVRDLSTFGYPRHVRITVGTEDQNRLLLEAVGEVISPHEA